MDLRALHTGLLLPVVALALLLPNPARAGWPNDPAVNVPLCTATGIQGATASVSDGAGGAIVSWRDDRNGNWDLYAQRISADGRPRWTADGVPICTASGEQYVPLIVSDGTGGAIVSWNDRRNGNWDLYAQRISAAGAVLWTADGVVLCTAPLNGVYPYHDAIPDGAGGALLSWFDNRSGNYDIYAQRISSAGAVQWTGNGVALCTATDDEWYPTIASDGAGGAIVTWEDERSGGDIYAQRISAAGTAWWTADGVALCTAAGGQGIPAIASDGAAGAIVAWQDSRRSGGSDIYAQRVSSGGVALWTADGVLVSDGVGSAQQAEIIADGEDGGIVAWGDNWTNDMNLYAQRLSAGGAKRWATNGVAICAAAGYQSPKAIAPDGAGGVIAAWHDERSGYGNGDVRAQRISAAGAVEWATDGLLLCAATGDQSYPTVTSDGVGGAIVTWDDGRNGIGTLDVYAQRVDRWGHLGAQPAIVNVRDVPNDQGGQVSLFWNASPLDASPSYAIGDYWIWRQVPAALAQSALARGASLLPDGATPADTPRGSFRTTTLGTTTFYWELVDTQIAQGFPGYSYVAPTTCDSVAGANPRTVFMVEARGALAGQWWFSDPDSGYSVDNLAPAAPSPFTGEYAGGTTTLHWGVSGAADFATFKLYRGHDASFVPGPASLVVTQADTGYVDVAGGAYFYKLAATDLHGNVSPYAFLQPSGTVDVPGADLSRELALSAPAPNPLRGLCTMRLALPRPGQVALAVYDQQGRRVRTLLAGALPAGEHPVIWDGRDDGGRPVASALYFVRLETGGRAISRRLVVVR